MRIGVVSDTHIPRKSKALPDALIKGFKDVDLIIHAGDINADWVIYELEEIAPVEAVAGNTDSEHILGLFGRKRKLDIGGCSIGIIHGDGDRGRTVDRAIQAFHGEKLDCIVFGHSHIPYNEVIDGILLFNPGSPTDKRRQEYFSFGILEVSGSGVTGEIKYF